MKIFRNASLRILLFSMFAMSLSSIVMGGTIRPDDFDIVIVSSGGGSPVHPETMTGCSVLITKGHLAELPDSIIITATPKTMSSPLTMSIDPKVLFATDSPGVQISNLFGGYFGYLIVNYKLTVKNSTDILVKSLDVTHPSPEFCEAALTEFRLNTHSSNYGSPMQNLNIFPTPCYTNQNILYELSKGVYVSISIFDMRGKLHTIVKDGYQEKGYYSIYADTSLLPSGTYFYKIEVDGMPFNFKFVKVNE